MKKILRGEPLLKRAEELGVSTNELWGGRAENPLLIEQELQRRVIEAERFIRDGRLWLIALISSIASVVSAIAAWAAIFYGKCF